MQKISHAGTIVLDHGEKERPESLTWEKVDLLKKKISKNNKKKSLKTVIPSLADVPLETGALF